MIRRNTIRTSPHSLSDGGALHGHFIIPSHNLTENDHSFCLSPSPAACPLKKHYKLNPSGLLFYILFFPPKSYSVLLLALRRKGWSGNHKTYNETKFILFYSLSHM